MSTSFSPVPGQRSRHDGWTAERQISFIEALGDYGIVRAAAEKVGKTAASAYRLRQSEGADSFANAWDRALSIGMMRLQDIAMDRAINGVPVPRFYKGEQVGEVRYYDNRLLTFMLRHTCPRLFGRYAAEEEVLLNQDRVQAEAEAHRLSQLVLAESMLSATQAEMDEIAAAPSVNLDYEEYERRSIVQNRFDRLESIIGQLRLIDTLRASEASINQMVANGTYSVRKGNLYKRKLQTHGP